MIKDIIEDMKKSEYSTLPDKSFYDQEMNQAKSRRAAEEPTEEKKQGYGDDVDLMVCASKYVLLIVGNAL